MDRIFVYDNDSNTTDYDDLIYSDSDSDTNSEDDLEFQMQIQKEKESMFSCNNMHNLTNVKRTKSEMGLFSDYPHFYSLTREGTDKEILFA
jgi:hypothetical protein